MFKMRCAELIMYQHFHFACFNIVTSIVMLSVETRLILIFLAWTRSSGGIPIIKMNVFKLAKENKKYCTQSDKDGERLQLSLIPE